MPLTEFWTKDKLTTDNLQTVNLTVLAEAEFDPRNPQTIDELLDEMPDKILRLYEWCEREDVVDAKGLAEAPPELKSAISDHKLRPKVLKLLLWRKTTNFRVISPEVQIYAD